MVDLTLIELPRIPPYEQMDMDARCPECDRPWTALRLQLAREGLKHKWPFRRVVTFCESKCNLWTPGYGDIRRTLVELKVLRTYLSRIYQRGFLAQALHPGNPTTIAHCSSSSSGSARS